MTRAHRKARLSLIRAVGVLMGSAFLIGGLLAFVPGVTQDGMYFGLFMVNTPHNIMHIASGTMFLIASAMGAKPTRMWFLIFGVFYGALGVIGLFVSNGLIFGLIMSSPFDSWGHMGLALIMLSVGFFIGNGRVPVPLDQGRFGPWAVVTGASSGIGFEFAHRLAECGINLVLVARREALLRDLGDSCARNYGIEYRAISLDLSSEDFISTLAEATKDLDVGLVISNAGTGRPGVFLDNDRGDMAMKLRLNTLAHLEMAYHFGKRLVARNRGGLLLVGAMGADKGIPYMANDGAAKTYVQNLAEALHVEWKDHGVYVTALLPGPTDTPVLKQFGLSPDAMPVKPMSAEQCAGEALVALADNRSRIIPGRLNRAMNFLIPTTVTRRLMASVFKRAFTG